MGALCKQRQMQVCSLKAAASAASTGARLNPGGSATGGTTGGGALTLVACCPSCPGSSRRVAVCAEGQGTGAAA